MNYSLVRSSLKNGQIVFFNATTWTQKLVSMGSGGKFAHVGILVWMTDSNQTAKLMCIESSWGGARLVQLSSYAYRGMTIVDIGLDWERCSDSAFNDTGRLRYSLLNLIMVGTKSILETVGLLWLANKIKRISTKGEICSEFVATLLDENGYPIEDTFASPNKLFTMLSKLPTYVSTLEVPSEGKTDSHK